MSPGPPDALPPAPRLYVHGKPLARPGPLARALAALAALACLAGLVYAQRLTPDARGVGTHRQLGMPACSLLARTGLPCPTCGVTTSLALAADGRFLASAHNQPLGALLAFGAACGAIGGTYVAATGRPAKRWLAGLVTPRGVLVAAALVLAAWAWKVMLMVAAR